MKKLEEYFSEYNISPGKLSVLIALARSEDPGGVLPSGLAESIGVTRGTITGLLDGLEKQNFIMRKLRSDEDRRKVRVILTPEGRSFLAGFLPAHYRKMSVISSELNDNDKAILAQLLVKIEKGVESL